MTNAESVLERFDGLFQDMADRGRPAHKAVPPFEKSIGMRESATRIIEEMQLGKTAVRFMVFSSNETSQHEDTEGQLLYSPSITAFTGVRKRRSLRVKRSDLESQPKTVEEKRQRSKAIRTLRRIEKRFTQFEQSSE